MKILNTQEYVNEKLNIQPIAKDKLKSIPIYGMYKTPSEMRNNFKTGDIALFSCFSNNTLAVYISYEDLSENKYPFVSDRLSSSVMKLWDEGIFVTRSDGELTLFCGLSECDENLEGKTYNVWKVYRNYPKPLTERDFTNPLMSKSVLIYQGNANF